MTATVSAPADAQEEAHPHAARWAGIRRHVRFEDMPIMAPKSVYEDHMRRATTVSPRRLRQALAGKSPKWTIRSPRVQYRTLIYRLARTPASGIVGSSIAARRQR